MPWTDEYDFRAPLRALKADQADALATELNREIAPGHVLYNGTWRVLARALPNDDIVVECGDRVAVVHLTWSAKQEAPPWPIATFMPTAEDLEAFVASEYDWEL